MLHLIDGINYNHIKYISDWMLTEESIRSALALIVGAISRQDITQDWGSGQSSSSDGQRFALRRKFVPELFIAICAFGWNFKIAITAIINLPRPRP